jgi:Ca2+-binding RTX toxin-like protein
MTLSTSTTDGGRVETFVDASTGLNVLHAQKYDASGQKVGAELTFSERVVGPYDVAALAGGGYAIVYQSASPGGSWGQISVQDAAGAVIGQGSTAGGADFHITAGQDGGFLVSYEGIFSDHGLTPSQPLVQLYDPTGQSLTHGHIELAGQITAISAAAGGTIAVTWDDGGAPRTLTLDPHTAAALTTPATPTVTVLDDAGAQTGAVAAGATTDDATPTFRVAVSQTGEVFVELDKDPGTGAAYQNHGGGIAITAEDVARGYVDVTLPTSGDGHYQAWARVTDASGSASYPVALDFTLQAADPSPASPPPPVAGGGEVLAAQHSGDVVTGTSGGDTITAADGRHALFGQDGNDSISGGTGFDVINGNKGDDTLAGHSTVGDWLSGGQGDDVITAGGGANVVNGNLGDDTVVGGSGHDMLRGGQGADSIVAGSGDAWISGDRGDDTIQAGAGSDVIFSFAGGGSDRVLGFDPLHDHVVIDGGAHVSASQVGADTVVDLGGGDRLVLAGVQLTSLANGWLVH